MTATVIMKGMFCVIWNATFQIIQNMPFSAKMPQVHFRISNFVCFFLFCFDVLFHVLRVLNRIFPPILPKSQH